MNDLQRLWLMTWVGAFVITGIIVGLILLWPPLAVLPVIGFVIGFYFYLGRKHD